MEEKEKQQHVAPVNNFYGNINNYNVYNAPVTYQAPVNNINGKDEKPISRNEEEIRNVLNDLLESKDERGEAIMAYNYQWYAVFRVLNESCNFPNSMKDFCNIMKEWGMGNATPPCKYDSLKKVASDMPKLSVKVELWHEYRNLSEQYLKQYNVAKYLLENLGMS